MSDPLGVVRCYSPELNYYFYEYWKNYGEIKLEYVKVPEAYGPRGLYPSRVCFLELLFNNHYSESSFNYYFRRESVTVCPKPVWQRLNTIGTVPTFFCTDSTCDFVTDTTGNIHVIANHCSSEENLFNIEEEEAILLYYLLQYRLGSTFDLTFPITTLTKPLSKLIYIYLDMMLHYNYEYFYTYPDVIASSNNILETMFELYVMNEAHKLAKNWDFVIDSDIIRMYPIRQKIIATQEMVTHKQLCLKFDPEENIFIFINGDLQDNDYFHLLPIDTTGCICDATSFVSVLSWEDPISIVVDDMILIESYSIVKVNMVTMPTVWEEHQFIHPEWVPETKVYPIVVRNEDDP